MVDNGIKESRCGYSYRELSFDNWEEIRNYLIGWEKHGLNITETFLFRGHSDSCWELEPTLERIRPDLEGNFLGEWYKHAEKLSVDNYKRAINLFIDEKGYRYISNNITQLEWLSLMQHYGAATRLLDATSSPLIAAFFAVSDVKELTKERCIWAFPLKIVDEKNIKTIEVKTTDKYKELYDYYQTLDINSENDIPIIGYTFNNKIFDRPYLQQGAFIYSMSNTKKFTNLLKEYYNDYTKLFKMTFRFSGYSDFSHAIRDLKNMNITYSSLFPGIEGYSKDIFLYQFIVNAPYT